jgi:hypothetical protein
MNYTLSGNQQTYLQNSDYIMELKYVNFKKSLNF